jgi:ribosomal protein L37AE/L43A
MSGQRLCAVCRSRPAIRTLLDVWYCGRCAAREDVEPPRRPGEG